MIRKRARIVRKRSRGRGPAWSVVVCTALWGLPAAPVHAQPGRDGTAPDLLAAHSTTLGALSGWQAPHPGYLSVEWRTRSVQDLPGMARSEPPGPYAVSDAPPPMADRGDGSSHWLGAAIGGVIGFAGSYVILNSGDSTAPCDESANQDAIGTRYCVGLYVLGGLAGAGVGWLVGKWIGDG